MIASFVEIKPTLAQAPEPGMVAKFSPGSRRGPDARGNGSGDYYC
jgi:hypothetical protein